MLGIGTSLRSSRGLRSSAAFNPTALFGLTDTGWVYEHSDFSTLFQDAAGTIPVTAVGQPVGRQLDKSGKGNHRTQSIALNRPTLARHPLGGIRNLLTYTEEFDNAAWVKANTSVTSGAESIIIPNTTNGEHRFFQEIVTRASVGNIVRCAIDVKASGYNFAWIGSFNGTNYNYAIVDLTDGSIDAQSASGSPTITSLGDGWYRIAISGSVSGINRAYHAFCPVAAAAVGLTTINVPTFAGNGTSGCFARYPQMEFNSTATDYQRVTTPFDVTEAGVPDLHYLSYDGINDSMATASFAWGTDKATVVAGVRKLSDAAGARTIVETSTNSDSTNGTFRLGTDAATFTWRSRGTVSANPSGAGAQPITAVLTGIGDIAGDVARLRRNAAQVGEVLTDQGTGNLLTYPAYFGARAGTSLFFNGREYSQFAINRLLTAAELAQIEAYTAGKTGVVL